VTNEDKMEEDNEEEEGEDNVACYWPSLF